jgi:hypothetical protein
MFARALEDAEVLASHENYHDLADRARTSERSSEPWSLKVAT